MLARFCASPLDKFQAPLAAGQSGVIRTSGFPLRRLDMFPKGNDQQSVSHLAFSYTKSRSRPGRDRAIAVDRRTIYSILGTIARSPAREFQFLSGVWNPCVARGHFRILATQAEGNMELWVSHVDASGHCWGSSGD